MFVEAFLERPKLKITLLNHRITGIKDDKKQWCFGGLGYKVWDFKVHSLVWMWYATWDKQ